MFRINNILRCKPSIIANRFMVNRNVTNRSFKISEKSRDVGPIGYFLLLVPGTTFLLGSWQVQRRKWKLSLIEELRQKTTAEPIELPENLESVEDMEYRRVKVRGRFLHENEMYVRPRSLLTPEGAEKASGGLMYTGQTGAYVITPFKVSDSEDTILVNRGWVPRNKISPNTRLNGQTTEELEIVGIVRKSEPRQPLAPKQSVSDGNRFWTLRDINKMAETVNCAPVFIDACITPSNPIREDAPIPGQTRITLRNEHMSYILTWYSLSLATSFLWYRRFILGKSLM